MMLARPVRAIAFGLLHRLRPGDRLLSEMDLQRKSESWTQEQRETHQNARLNALLDHCEAQVPHYRRLLDSREQKTGTRDAFERLRRLPTVDKSAIRAQPDAFLARDFPAARRIASDTGGSTGSVLRFYVDRDSTHARNATTFGFYRWCGIAPVDRHAMLWGAPFDAPSTRSATERLRAQIHPLLFLSSFDLSDRSLDDYAQRLQAHAPRLLTSYPSPLMQLIEHLRASGRAIPSLRAVISSAEQLYPQQRERIEQTLATPVFDRYGSREFGNLAQECEEHRGLHVAAHRTVIEILADDDLPVGTGETGEIVVTDLDNFAHPFVRYRTGDLASWLEGDCPCGRRLPRLAAVQGRRMDVVSSPSGHRLAGTFWTLMLRKVSERVLDFQVVQRRADTVVIFLRLDGDAALTQEESERLLRWVRDAAPDLRVEIDCSGSFQNTRAGKRRVVIREIDSSS